MEVKEEEETKFKEVSEAYSILSDPQKKMRYDSGQDLEEMGGARELIPPNLQLFSYRGFLYKILTPLKCSLLSLEEEGEGTEMERDLRVLEEGAHNSLRLDRVRNLAGSCDYLFELLIVIKLIFSFKKIILLSRHNNKKGFKNKLKMIKTCH